MIFVAKGAPVEPLISIIIPVYNVLPYLREALDSIIHQTWKKLEIIVVDDGSMDGSGEVCDEYAIDPRVKVIHQENRGLSGARNTGLDHMTGEYVAFLDPDDAFHPEMIERLYDAMYRSGAELALCDYDTFITEGPLTAAKKKESVSFRKEEVLSRQEVLRILAAGKYPMVVWNKLYSGSLWNDLCFPVGLVYEDVRIAPLILEQCSHIIITPQMLVHHRRRPGSITQVYSLKNTRDYFDAFISVFDSLKRMQPSLSDECIETCREKVLRMMILRWGLFRKKGNTPEEIDALRAAILDFAEHETEFMRLKTKAVWWMFQHSPGILNGTHTCYRGLLRIRTSVINWKKATNKAE